MKIRNIHFDTVSIIRGMAVFIIVAIHAPLSTTLINSVYHEYLAATGHVAVRMFFFLSGFVLGYRLDL